MTIEQRAIKIAAEHQALRCRNDPNEQLRDWKCWAKFFLECAEQEERILIRFREEKSDQLCLNLF